LPSELLTAIEENIEAKNRSKKLLKCIEAGFSQLTQENTLV